MTPQEQRNKRFDEKFPKSEYFENYARLSFEGADDKVKDFLTSEVNLTIEQVEKWLEGDIKAVQAFINKKTEENDINDRLLGYSSGRLTLNRDLLNFLNTLK